MQFIHPGMAAAAGALALIPILLHLINRRNYARQPWAAMAFLKRAHRHTRRRMRLERLALLALRTAAMVLICFALARPLWSASIAGGLRGESRVDRVIVLDDSGSMRARETGERTAFDAARATVLELLDRFGATDAVSIVTVAAPARALLDRPILDAGEVRRLAGRQTVSYAATDARGALDAARAVLAASDLPADLRAVYIVSDFAGSGWSAGEDADAAALSSAARRLAEQGRVFLIPAGGPKRDNAAVIELACADRLVGVEWPVAMTARVANFGGGALGGAKLEWRRGGRVVRTTALDPLAPGESRAVRERIAFEGPGVQSLGVRLVTAGDALRFDDVRCVAVDVARRLRVLLVDGRPTPVETSETLYLARALNPTPGESERGYFDPVVIDAGELATTALSDVRAIVLAGVRDLPGAQWARLEAFVRDGGGLLIAPGDQLAADADPSAARGLLPARLERRVEAGNANGASPGSGTGLRVAAAAHPALADFELQPAGGLSSARFIRYWRTSPVDDARVVLAFEDGGAALLERPVGDGLVWLWTSTLNMAWSNLPAKPDFVPLMLNGLAHLAPRADARRNVALGAEWVAPLPGGLSGAVTLRGPDGSTTELTPSTSDGRLALRVRTGRGAPLGAPGDYELLIGKTAERLCVNAGPDESDLRGPDRVALRALFGPSTTILADADGLVRAATPAARREWSGALVFVLLAVVLVETFAAAWFGSRR